MLPVSPRVGAPWGNSLACIGLKIPSLTIGIVRVALPAMRSARVRWGSSSPPESGTNLDELWIARSAVLFGHRHDGGSSCWCVPLRLLRLLKASRDARRSAAITVSIALA